MAEKKTGQETLKETPPIKKPKGRPRLSKEEKDSTERLCLDMPKELKYKMDKLKYKTYKKSYREIIVEALLDILKKYGIE